MQQDESRVIVAGCGPVGAVMALALVRKGIPVLLMEAEPEPVEDQRAATIHAPTLEMLAELGLKEQAFAEDAIRRLSAPLFQFLDRTTHEVVAVFDVRVLEGAVPYPYVLQWEQYKLVHAALPLIRGERSRRGALLDQAHRPRAARRPRRRHRRQRGRRNRDAARRLRHRHRRRPQHGAPSRRDRVRRLHLGGALHQDRHQLRFRRRDRQGLLHAQLFFRSRRVAQSVQGQGQRPARHLARHHAGAGARNRRAGAEHGGIQRRLHGIHHEERRFRYSVSRALCRASARRRNLQQGPRAARRRQRPRQQSDRRHGHERRHPRRRNLAQKLADIWFGRARATCSTATPASAARPRSISSRRSRSRTRRRWRKRIRSSAASISTSCGACPRTWRCTRSISIDVADRQPERPTRWSDVSHSVSPSPGAPRCGSRATAARDPVSAITSRPAPGASSGAAPFSTAPHFSSIARASSCVSAEVGGNLSIQANGLQASMIALECEVTPRALVLRRDARIERRRPGVAHDVDLLGRLAARGDRPHHVVEVGGIDVLVDHHDQPRPYSCWRRRSAPARLAWPA